MLIVPPIIAAAALLQAPSNPNPKSFRSSWLPKQSVFDLSLMMADAKAKATDEASTPATSRSQDLLPILSHALPSVISYRLPGESVVQGNAEGSRVLVRHSSSASEKFEGTARTIGDHGDERELVAAQAQTDGQIEETELFLKRVTASSYAHKSWTDMVSTTTTHNTFCFPNPR